MLKQISTVCILLKIAERQTFYSFTQLSVVVKSPKGLETLLNDIRDNWFDLSNEMQSKYGGKRPSEEVLGVGFILGGLNLIIAIVAFLAISLPAIFTLIKIQVAPKVYLIEYMRSML